MTIPAIAPQSHPSPTPVHKPDPKIADLKHMIRARFSVICIMSPEEERVLQRLATWISNGDLFHNRVKRWSYTEGLVEHRSLTAAPKVDEGTRDPSAALDKVLQAPANEGTLFVFRDLHPFLTAHSDPAIVRKLRDCAHRLRATDNCLILLSPHMKLPADLEKVVAVTDYPLPDAYEIGGLVDHSYRDFRDNPNKFVDQFNAELREEIVRACSGLTESEISDALSKAVIACNGFVPAMVDALHKVKQEAIRRTRCLEAIQMDESMDEVGGLDNMKTWVRKRLRTWGDEARKYGIDYPRGLLALGIPGGGKSLSAKAVAHQWRLPLLRLDMGAVFGGLVGESEGNLRAALRIAEALAPCVLWVDELEKGLSGVGSSDRSDGGTSARVFGTFLTWMQEKKAPVFVLATANSITGVPPELLRKGRFDEIFFIDLPNEDERAEIIEIHLRKRQRDPARFAIRELANTCEGFVGAEIEQAVREAIIDAFDEQAQDVTNRHIIHAFQRTVPLVKTQRDKIRVLLEFVEQGRAVRASTGRRVELTDAFWNGGAATAGVTAY